MTGKRFRKIIMQMVLVFYILKNWKYVQVIFQKLIRIVKKIFFLNDSK